MATRLSENAIERAIDHICKYGDTDVFPHLPEIAFLKDCKKEVIAELSSIDLDTFEPSQAVEALSPKSRYGFRIAHQLQLPEALLFSAATIQIAPDLEKLKPGLHTFGPFAYRFSAAGGPSLFLEDRTYRDWLAWQSELIDNAAYIGVVFTDIADFYQRIYLHRLEGCLDTATSEKGVKKYIEKAIKNIRSRQSYGIPVGGSASRLIAEAVLADSDAALLDEDIAFSRFVDDFRIFVREDQDDYEILSFLAKQLFLGEGLTLNGQKTKVLPIDRFREFLQKEMPGTIAEAEDKAFEALSAIVYFDESPDPDAVDELRSLNLVGMLETYVSDENWDFGKIKAVLKALRITEAQNGLPFISDHLEILMPFAKEILLYCDQLKRSGFQFEEEFGDRVVATASSVAAKAVPTIHAWLLEFFVRGISPIDSKSLNKLAIDTPLYDRQISLIRGRNGDVNYFRRNKTTFDTQSSFAKWAFIMGATCLQKDEYDAWIGAIRSRMNRPLDKLFCAWAKGKVGMLAKVLEARPADEDIAES